jgi:hypothetical protein
VRMWFGVSGITMIEYFICNSTVKNSFKFPLRTITRSVIIFAVARYNSQPQIMIASKNVTILAKILRLHG